jgi:hypothetical protein
MLVYRDGGKEVDVGEELARLRAAPNLVDVGAFEAAVVDAMMPERDGIDPRAVRLRAASVEAARTSLGTRTERHALDALDAASLPRRATLRVAEGFAYYALFPETYAIAARDLARARRFDRACVIGLRSIGTTLSAMVAAALEAEACDVESFTARPRGNPVDRTLRLDDALADAWRGEAARGATFIVVDEGPGLSGSSFAAAIEALVVLGVPMNRIVAMPSFCPEASRLGSPRARRAWSAVTKVTVGAFEAGISPERAHRITGGSVDWSAGKWRPALFSHESAWPAVHPDHERWKVLVPEANRLLKFVGLGSYGLAARARAERLADLGLGPRPGALRDGFLDLPFTPGEPLVRCRGTSDAAHVGEYVGRVAVAFPTNDLVELGALHEMICVNLREASGDVPRELPLALETFRRDLRAVAIDGRMLAHEWIASDAGLFKVDALDHSCDHFFPGPQHPAWDLAAAKIELRMTPSEADAMTYAYEKRTGDREARGTLSFFELAYSAFRLGYASLALERATGDERARLLRARSRYSQCALKAVACFTASSKSPRKQMARSSMKT